MLNKPSSSAITVTEVNRFETSMLADDCTPKATIGKPNVEICQEQEEAQI